MSGFEYDWRLEDPEEYALLTNRLYKTHQQQGFARFVDKAINDIKELNLRDALTILAELREALAADQRSRAKVLRTQHKAYCKALRQKRELAELRAVTGRMSKEEAKEVMDRIDRFLWVMRKTLRL